MYRIAVVVLSLALAAASFSLRLAAASDGDGASGVNWIKYADPAEHAFALNVPQGWEVKGGLYRFGYFDVRWMMDARSPDSKIIIRIDDVNVPPYVLPGPSTGAEGQPYDKPREFQMVVERYQNADAYAQTYLASRFKHICQSLTPQAGGWKPTLPPEFQANNAVNQTDASITTTCSTSDGPRVAIVYSRTSLFQGNNYAFWTADPLISILSTPKEMSTAQAIVQHMLDSFHKNPQWVQYQNQMTQAGAQMIQQNFQTFMAQMRAYDQARSSAMNQQVAGFEARQNASQRQSSSFGETLTGLQDAVDPQTGQRFQVWTGPGANYYRNGLGDTVNGNTSPGSDYHQVNPVPNE
jgi:hypothetical protein